MENPLKQLRLDLKAKRGPFPTHGRTLGYLGSVREPYTWFVCNNGHTEMGNPWAAPGRDCRKCEWDSLTKKRPEFTGWEVADGARSFSATMDAIGPSERKGSLYRRTQA